MNASNVQFSKPNRSPDWYDVHTARGVHKFETPKAAFHASLEAFPFWVKPAMALRNLLVRPFGLHTSPPATQGQNPLAALPVHLDDAQLFEAGLTDKHLTFSIMVTFVGDHVHYRTNIWFHHLLGRAYLAVVYWPHKWIMQSTVRKLNRSNLARTNG